MSVKELGSIEASSFLSAWFSDVWELGSTVVGVFSSACSEVLKEPGSAEVGTFFSSVSCWAFCTTGWSKQTKAKNVHNHK